jgi:hypothetical protein
MDEQLISQKRKMQMEMLMKESDAKKMEREKATIETELRELKHKINLIQAEMTSKESLIKKIEGEELLLHNEIIKMKHQMNSLGHEQSQ